ncbi:hypothetical protein ACIQRS_22045 [Streptomyces termitum]|uniref:Uncharacterized protein n=1 Tax=Streptomyces termitum TaxID=67368 RepID=A0A918T4J1_9ACTN|nr:hypothetical protein [Streptomyces termitum]GHA92684.1 hypothetical protein GCM10010305_40500 [Streptomyces termitum]
MSVQQATAVRTLETERPEDVREAAEALAAGQAVAHGFGHGRALTFRPDRDVLARVNRGRGRPADRPASLTTVPEHVPAAFDWTRLPDDVPRQQLRALIDELLALGPLGLRGPAADRVPAHLTATDGGLATARVAAPGTRCPSHAFLGAALGLTGGTFLAVTSVPGPGEEPAGPAIRVLAHAAGEAARRHPFHRPAPVSVLSFHRTAGHTRSGLPVLVLERHGSLSADHIRAVAATHGFGLAAAARPLVPRAYDPA